MTFRITERRFGNVFTSKKELKLFTYNVVAVRVKADTAIGE